MPRILLVEDEQVNREMFRRRLTARGFDVLTAENGERAIELTTAEKPELVLMDLGLPGIDGWEATRRLKANPATAGIPVIALSAHATADAKDKAFAAGCIDFETKPVQLDRLVGKITETLAARKLAPAAPATNATLDLVAEAPPTVAGPAATVAPPPVGSDTALIARGSGSVRSPAPRPVAAPEPPTDPGATAVVAPIPVLRKRILVVEDNDANRVMLARRLGRNGYDITEAADGKQALELVRKYRFDLVLLDIMMPEMDGYQVLEVLKDDEDLKALPVIMISAVDEMASVVRCIEMGAEDYLQKPYDPVLLQARINACLDKRRLRDQEVEYLRAVSDLTRSAVAVEKGDFDPAVLGTVAKREDALGVLARVFEKMAREVQARERQLRAEVERLKVIVEIDQRRKDEELAAVNRQIDDMGLEKKAEAIRAARDRRRAERTARPPEPPDPGSDTRIGPLPK